MSDYKSLTPYTIRKAQAGDQRALNDVARAFDPAFQAMARKLVAGTHYGKDMVDDLTQEAQLVLLQSLPSFDADKGTLQTFIFLNVRGAMRKALAKGITGPDIPDSTVRRYFSSTQDTDSNTVAEAKSGLGRGTFAAVHNVLHKTSAMASSEDDYGDHSFSGVELVDPDFQDDTVNRLFVDRLLECLPEREAYVVRLWAGLETGEPMNDTKVADVLGVSRTMAQKIRYRAIERLQAQEADREA